MKKLYISIIGFGAGLGVGYYITRYQTDKRLDELHAECDELMLHIERIENDGQELVSEDYGMVVEDTPEATNIYAGGDEKNKVNYSDIKPSIEELMAAREEETPDEDEPIEEEVQRVFDSSKPYVISDEQYAEVDGNEDKEVLTYYSGDDVLVDDADMPIDNTDFVVGTALDHFGLESGDPDIVYVRNEQTGCDYEIIKMTDSFQEAILGIVNMEGPTKHVVRSGDE